MKRYCLMYVEEIKGCWNENIEIESDDLKIVEKKFNELKNYFDYLQNNSHQAKQRFEVRKNNFDNDGDFVDYDILNQVYFG